MSKKTQGFASTGGSSFIPAKTTGGGYSASEVTAMAKVGATELGIRNFNPDHVELCLDCGRPLAGDQNSTPAMELEELAKGVHYRCFMQAEHVRLSKENARLASLPEAERERIEADRYNRSMVTDPRDTPIVSDDRAGAPAPYRPKPGEIPFARVQGGLSKALPEEPLVDLSEETLEEREQRATYERKGREDYENLPAELKTAQ